MTTATRLTICGKVQGVGFRAFVRARARAQGLRGWVRNRANGTVEALLIGEADAVAAVAKICHGGPALARVDSFEAVPADDDGSADFTERPTL